MILTSGRHCNHSLARPNCPCCTAEVKAITERVDGDLSRRGFMAGVTASVALLGLAAYAPKAAAQDAPGAILFRNARLFNGVDVNTREAMSVLVRDGRIAEVVQGEITPPEGTQVIEAGGRTLMPGLIDAHAHTMLSGLPLLTMLAADPADVHFAAGAQAERTLMRGFTSVRDLGGPSFALKRAIDSGMVAGPRIWPSGAMISQTSGHGDFRAIWELPGTSDKVTHTEAIGAAAIADGRAAVLQATREQLMRGASQIKIVAGGGASSLYDPLDVAQFLPEEIEAAVLAAADWGTYVCAHVYTPIGIQRCLKAGVRSIEHGQLTDEESVIMMADMGATWSLQPFTRENSDAENTPAYRLAKLSQLWDGTDNAYAWAIKHKVVTGFGTDILFDAKAAEKQGQFLAYMKRWYTPAQALKQATSDNAFVLGMSGLRNPYGEAKLGVIEAGAYADMLLVDGDPTENIDLVADPDTNFKVIMKDGRIYKNTL
jgi:imidazolonepropionase-like amidohydrolase